MIKMCLDLSILCDVDVEVILQVLDELYMVILEQYINVGLMCLVTPYLKANPNLLIPLTEQAAVKSCPHSIGGKK